MQRALHTVPNAKRFPRSAVLGALLLGLAAGQVLAQSNKVFRCTGANGKVTLSDRRCPDDDPATKAETAKPDTAARGETASGPALAASQLKACSDIRARVATQKRQARSSESQRAALRDLEDEQRRHCGA